MAKILPRIFAVLTALLILCSPALKADPEIESVKKSLPQMLGTNNIGKEFWFSVPPCYEDESGGAANFVKIFVTSAVKTRVVVEVPGKGTYFNKMTIPNDVIGFDITPAHAQCFLYSGRQDPPKPEAVYKGNGVHVYADDPVVVYVVVRYRATSDGFLAIPAASLGREYVVASYADMVGMYSWAVAFPSITTITAAYDNTMVKFIMGGTDRSQTAGGMKPKDMKEVMLNRGDVWIFMSNGADQDLTGSRIIASRPVAVVSGNHCTNIPTSNRWCDYTVEMDLPMHSWGHHYHVGKVPNRRYNGIVKIFSSRPQTKIYRDGNHFMMIPEGPGGIIQRGYHEIRVHDGSPRSAVFSGDKPINVVFYNPGTEEDITSANSDPFVMAMTPIEQYQREITFCTPAVQGGLNFADNYLNLCYETDSLGMMPDHIEFAKVHQGEFSWRRISTAFAGQDELFKYDIDGKKFAVKTILLPSDGVYKIRSATPFACYSYGFSSYDSYGYPTSAALADITVKDTVAPDPKWEILCDGSVTGATVTDRPDVDSVRSNLADIFFITEQSKNYIFEYERFVPGEAVTTTWRLRVEDKMKDAVAFIKFVDRAGNDTLIKIEYFAPKFEILPTTYNFGKLKLGEQASTQFKVKNNSATGPITITSVSLKEGTQNFAMSIEGNVEFPYSLPPLQEIGVNITFTAAADGNYRDLINVWDDCENMLEAEVLARVGTPIIEVSDHNYGKVRVGQRVEATLNILNSGTSSLIVTGYTGPNLGVYQADFGREISPAQPLTLEPGARFPFKVFFRPDAELTYPDQIVFDSDADGIDNVAVLNGEGIKPNLWASSYAWDRLRIHRNAFPAGPYQTSEAIRLINDGTEEVQILEVKVLEDINGNAFKFNRDAFKNMKVAGNGGEQYVKVEFLPEQTGYHKLVLQFINDAGSEAITTLEGTGLMPKIETKDQFFGEMIVNDVSDVKRHTIEFTNVSWEYADVLNITDLTIEPAGGISTDGMNFSATQGFLFDKAALNLPVQLNPGQSIEIPASFLARFHGEHQAQIRSVSDAEADMTSVWTGRGVAQGINASGGETTICVESTDKILCKVNNTDQGPIQIHRIRIDDPSGYFTVENAAQYENYTLEGGQTLEFYAIYAPMSVGVHSAVVHIDNSTLNTPTISVNVKGTAVHYHRNTASSVSAKNIDIGANTVFTVAIDNGEDMRLANVTELDFRVWYRKDFISLDRNRLDFKPQFTNMFNVSPAVYAEREIDGQKFEEMTFKLTAKPGMYLNQGGDVLAMTFNTFLPWYYDRDKDISLKADTATIYYDISPTGNRCFTITGGNKDVKLNEICVSNLRSIVYSGNRYSLQQVNPNPVGSSGGEIEFTIGLSAFAELKIYNSSSVLVATPVSGELSAGSYTVSIPIEKLSSGVYYYELTSGPFKEVKKMVVAK